MSKKGKTTNLELMTYINNIGIPTFLNEWTDNAEKIDAFAGSISSAISALDDRLTSAEETLSDLSPESIEDYKIRLDALEKKVVINTNNIKDFNTRVNTVDAQIRTVQAEQTTQNNRLTSLENITTQQATQISELGSSLASANSVIANNTSRIEALEHEVSDLQNDVNGFNDDITALATQVETLSTAVSALTELVNSLQLDVISENLNEIYNIIGNTDISSVANTITDAIIELADRIAELTPQAYEELVARVGALETDLTALTGVVANKADSSVVSALATDVAGKADSSTVSALDTRVGAVETTLSGLGSLATQNSASGSYTPSGSVNVVSTGESQGTLPNLVYDATTESISFDAGTLPTFGTISGTFSGDSATITVD